LLLIQLYVTTSTWSPTRMSSIESGNRESASNERIAQNRRPCHQHRSRAQREQGRDEAFHEHGVGTRTSFKNGNRATSRPVE